MCIINEISEIHFQRATSLTPGQFIAGLIDFAPIEARNVTGSLTNLKITPVFKNAEASS